MQIAARSKRPQLQKRDALETETYDWRHPSVARSFIPQTPIRLQQLRILSREAIKTRAPKTVFALDDEAQCHRKFAKCFLIGFNRGETRNQISFAVCRTTRVQLSVLNCCRKRPRRPLVELAHRLHIVVTVNNKRFRTTATLAIQDRISRTDAKRPRAHADSLHRLFDRLSNRAHACATRGDGGHAAEVLQALRKATGVTIYVTIEFCNRHSYTKSTKLVDLFLVKQKVPGLFSSPFKSGTNQILFKRRVEFRS